MVEIKWPILGDNPVNYTTHIVKDLKELEHFLRKVEGVISFDYETTPLPEVLQKNQEEIDCLEASNVEALEVAQKDYKINIEALGEKKAAALLKKVQAKIEKYDFNAKIKALRATRVAMPFDAHKAYVCTVSWCCNTGKEAYVVFFTDAEESDKGMKLFKELIFENKNIIKLAFNMAFEAMFSLRYKARMLGQVIDPFIMAVRCTQVAAPEKIANPKAPVIGKGLKNQALEILGYEMQHFEDLLERKNAEFFGDLDYSDPDVTRYAAEDSVCSYLLAQYWAEVALQIPVPRDEMNETRNPTTYMQWLLDVEMPFTTSIGEMQYNGMLWNTEAAESIQIFAESESVRLLADIQDTAKKLAEMYEAAGAVAENGKPLNLSEYKKLDLGKTAKNKAMKEFLLEILQIPTAKNSDITGAVSFDKEAMLDSVFMLENNLLDITEEKYLGVELPADLRPEDMTPAQVKAYNVQHRNPTFAKKEKLHLLKQMGELQKVSTLLSSHIKGRTEHLNDVTGRIHSSYTQWTETSRTNSQKPNGQNNPRPDNDPFKIRSLYRPKAGYVYVLSDYSGFELRLMAWKSGDKDMRDLLNNGGDLHKAVACVLTGKKPEDITKHERNQAKAGNFGINYGGTEHAIQSTLKKMGIRLSLDECLKIVNAVKTRFPGIVDFQEKSAKFAAEHGYIDTIYGYKRMLPGINSNNKQARRMAERQASNTPIQGSAADIMKVAQQKIYQILAEPRFKDITNVAQIHDEVIYEVPRDKKLIAEFVGVLKNVMEQPPLPDFPVKLIADVSIAAENWSKKIDYDDFMKLA